jgi:hypothetical protein
MAESSAKVRITLDGQQPIKEAERMKKGVKGVGDEINQWGKGLAKTMVLSTALLGTLRSMAQAQRAAGDAAANMSKDVGDASLKLAVTMARLKITGTQAQAIKAYAAKDPEVAGFLESLAGVRSRGKPDYVGAADAFTSGVMSPDEIRDKFKRGDSLPLAVGERMRQVEADPDAQVELDTRRQEQVLNMRKRQFASPGMRLAKQREELRRLANPRAQALGEAAEGLLENVGVVFDQEQKDQGFMRTLIKDSAFDPDIWKTNRRPQIGAQSENAP